MPRPPFDLFTITAPGIEAITAGELQALGITPEAVERGGVSWAGGLSEMYAANLWLRTASRVVVRVASAPAKTFYELERKAKRIPWERYVVPGRPVRFRVTCRKSRLYHSDAVAQRLSEAVAPIVGDEGLVGVARKDEEQEPTDAQLFVVRVDHDIVTISADTSGTLLHKRGYRQVTAKAPLRETLAAAMLLASGWDQHSPLVDPLCGSGTIPIEAALMARRIAPGRNRHFAFQHWPEADLEQWQLLRLRARELELPRVPGLIRGSDRDAGAVRSALANAERAGVEGDIDLSQCPISAVEPAGGRGWIITNPPYGVRVGDKGGKGTVRNLYAQFGNVLRGVYPGWHLGILSADPVLERQIRVPLERSFSTSNGGIPVRFVTGAVSHEGGPRNG